MTILIWIVVLFVESAIVTALQEFGIILGMIPRLVMYILTIMLAAFLSMKWDYGRFKRKAKKAGKTPLEYAKTQYYTSILDMCCTYINDKKEFNNMLKQCSGAGTITRKDCRILKALFKDKLVLEEIDCRRGKDDKFEI